MRLREGWGLAQRVPSVQSSTQQRRDVVVLHVGCFAAGCSGVQGASGSVLAPVKGNNGKKQIDDTYQCEFQ